MMKKKEEEGEGKRESEREIEGKRVRGERGKE